MTNNHPNRSKATMTRHIVRGDFVDEHGYLRDFTPKRMEVDVDSQGRAWAVLPVDIAYDADEFGRPAPLVAERWRDGDRLGRQFSPDEGEFERCGIKFEVCG